MRERRPGCRHSPSKTGLNALMAPSGPQALRSRRYPKESIMKNINPNPFTTRPEIRGTFGVVASTHWLASAVGMSMLERGGNAFDAAVAAGFTLQVVEPHLNGPLGDNPILVWHQAARRAAMICGQGPAPAGATIAHYRSLGLDLVPGTGLLAAAIPGAFDAWATLL